MSLFCLSIVKATTSCVQHFEFWTSRTPQWQAQVWCSPSAVPRTYKVSETTATRAELLRSTRKCVDQHPCRSSNSALLEVHGPTFTGWNCWQRRVPNYKNSHYPSLITCQRVYLYSRHHSRPSVFMVSLTLPFGLLGCSSSWKVLMVKI